MKSVRLGDVALIQRQSVDPSKIDPNTIYLGLEHLARGGRIIGHDTVGSAALASSKFTFSSRHLLYGKLRPNLGKISRPTFSGVCSTDILPVLPGPQLDRGYLAHYLAQPSMVDFAASRAAGANLPRLSPATLAEFEIPLPPLEEQRRIAAILDHADALRTKRRQVLAHFESLETALYNDVFSSGGWPSFRLDEVASTTSGGTPNRARPENYGGGIPWVKSGELHSGLVMDTSETISDVGLTSSSASLMPAGTVLIAMYGATAGVVSRLGIDAATNQAICSITPGPQLDASYLIAALKSMSSQLRNLRSGGAQPNLSQAVIRALEIKVPSILAQQEFARKISGVASARQRVELGTATDDQLFASIQSRAFGGEL